MTGSLSSMLQTLKTVVRIARRSRPAGILSEDLPAHSELIVLGNGPSLKIDLQTDPAFFRSKPCICVNDFPRTDLFRQLKPRYYLMLDPAYWLPDSAEQLVRLRENVFRSIREECDWPLLFLAPIEAKRDLPENLFPGKENVRLEFFNNTPLWGLPSATRYFVRKGLGMYPALNVLAAALQVGIRLGYRKLYLFGGDHSWHQDLRLDDAATLCIQENHFYEEKVKLAPFYKDAAETVTWKMHEIFQRYSDIFANYMEIRKLADTMGVDILNGASTTFIDAFPRFSLKNRTLGGIRH